MNKTCPCGILKAESRRLDSFVGAATAALNISALQHPPGLRHNLYQHPATKDSRWKQHGGSAAWLSLLKKTEKRTINKE